MLVWRDTFLIKATLFFFVSMLLFNPVYAQQWPPVSLDVDADIPLNQNALPVIYVSEEEAQQLVWQLEGKGYRVKSGTLAQLDELTSTREEASEAESADKEESKEKPKKECAKEPQTEKVKKQSDGQGSEEPRQQVESENKKGTDESTTQQSEDECVTEKKVEESAQQKLNQHEGFESPVFPEPEPEPEPLPAPPIESQVQTSIGYQINVSGGSGGGSNHDFAKVFFIFAGIAVVAAFVVYAGKYIADIVGGKSKKLWREFIVNTTLLSTKSGRHGQFVGAKLATGFVSDELIQLALVGELGNTDLDLVLNENSNPTALDFSATYWMLGASARLHLSNKLVNASYLFLDFMGGTTSRKATDIISAARFGASFGLDDHWRLGASLGAQYIGLDEDQGFSNDGENYWLTYGFEIGAQF